MTATVNQPSDATHVEDEFPPVTHQCTVKANSAGPAAQKCEGLTQQMIQTNALLETLINTLVSILLIPGEIVTGLVRILFFQDLGGIRSGS